MNGTLIVDKKMSLKPVEPIQVIKVIVTMNVLVNYITTNKSTKNCVENQTFFSIYKNLLNVNVYQIFKIKVISPTQGNFFNSEKELATQLLSFIKENRKKNVNIYKVNEIFLSIYQKESNEKMKRFFVCSLDWNGS